MIRKHLWFVYPTFKLKETALKKKDGWDILQFLSWKKQYFLFSLYHSSLDGGPYLIRMCLSVQQSSYVTSPSSWSGQFAPGLNWSPGYYIPKTEDSHFFLPSATNVLSFLQKPRLLPLRSNKERLKNYGLFKQECCLFSLQFWERQWRNTVNSWCHLTSIFSVNRMDIWNFCTEKETATVILVLFQEEKNSIGLKIIGTIGE